jgi:hypothetical protein
LLNRAHRPPRLDTPNRPEGSESIDSTSAFVVVTVPPKGI